MTITITDMRIRKAYLEGLAPIQMTEAVERELVSLTRVLTTAELLYEQQRTDRINAARVALGQDLHAPDDGWLTGWKCR